jgi:hypothetical protein
MLTVREYKNIEAFFEAEGAHLQEIQPEDKDVGIFDSYIFYEFEDKNYEIDLRVYYDCLEFGFKAILDHSEEIYL